MASVYRAIIIAAEALAERMRAERPAGANPAHFALRYAPGPDLAFVCRECAIPDGYRKIGAGPSDAHLEGREPRCEACGGRLRAVAAGREVDTQYMMSRVREIA